MKLYKIYVSEIDSPGGGYFIPIKSRFKNEYNPHLYWLNRNPFWDYDASGSDFWPDDELTPSNKIKNEIKRELIAYLLSRFSEDLI